MQRLFPAERKRMIDQFQKAAEAAGAVVKRFPSLAATAAHVRNTTGAIIAASELPDDIRQALAPVIFAAPENYPGVRSCVSFARAGITDSGSLLLQLSDHLERSATALPPVHLVFLRASSLVPDLAALADTIATLLASRPHSYLSLITGPSRTADIERVLTIGVHGPKELQILLLEGE
ncbi:MAG: lactate utilization protein [Deltaproteobacteria bacterium]|nr:lactate utilization protein [Deltaproteobacteria bacterium]TLN00450.1 MAG: lactate utilization protein [bacterium]